MLPAIPLSLLVVALGSIFWYRQTANDIYKVLAAVTAISCLLWGFAIAHWSIHLLCLILLFLKFDILSWNRVGSGK